MRKLLNILFGVFIFVVAFTVARQAVKYGISEFNEYSNQTNFKKDTIESIKKLNNKTPIIVDENTKITEVKLEDDVIIYTTILGGIDYDSINVKQFSKSQKITNIFFLCQKDDIKKLLKNGFNIKYDYFSPRKVSLFGNQITSKDCQPFFGKDTSQLVDYFIKLQLELIPMMIDSETKLINIQRSGNTIEIIYELINYSKDEIDFNIFSEIMDESLPVKNCRGPDSKLFLKNGINFIDTYFDNSGVKVYSFETKLSNC